MKKLKDNTVVPDYTLTHVATKNISAILDQDITFRQRADLYFKDTTKISATEYNKLSDGNLDCTVTGSRTVANLVGNAIETIVTITQYYLPK